MANKRNRYYRMANYPEHRDSKYIVVDGEIFLNLAYEPGGIIVGRFLKSTETGAGRRDR